MPKKKPKTTRPPTKLAPMQERFCQEYIVDLNGKEAALRAGYAPKYADDQAVQLLRKPLVIAEVARLKSLRAERVSVTADRVVEELGVLAFSNVDNYEIDQFTGRVKPAEGADKSVMRAVSSIRTKFEKGTLASVELKLWDKPATLRLVGQHLDMWDGKTTAPSSIVIVNPYNDKK